MSLRSYVLVKLLADRYPMNYEQDQHLLIVYTITNEGMMKREKREIQEGLNIE
jgi:hypothetical protein